MSEFLDLIPPGEAFQKLVENKLDRIEAEEIFTDEASGRITADSIVANAPLPAFNRSSVDGYAVHASDTYGASDTLPAYLVVAGEIPMGFAPINPLETAQCCAIHTGGMLPQGADAVVMLEHTQKSRENEIELFKAVAVGENVINAGEDVTIGQVVIGSGTRLRPSEIGGLMALGITRVRVIRKPRVAIISSGDELVTPESDLPPGNVRDINSYSLSALVEEHGGIAIRYGIVPDDSEKLFQVASQALSECDMVVITAGSSASVRDFTSSVINRLGEPGVLVHGLNVRPGKPTILGKCQGKAVIGLPGNPVSALVIAGLVLVPLIRHLTGQSLARPEPSITAKLNLNLSSQAGREDWVPVRLKVGENGIIAEPVFGKSNLIFTLTRADGLIRISPESNGLPAGVAVQVFLL